MDAHAPANPLVADDQGAGMRAFGAAQRGQQVDEDVARVKLAIRKPQIIESGSLRRAARFRQPLRIEEAEAISAERYVHQTWPVCRIVLWPCASS